MRYYLPALSYPFRDRPFVFVFMALMSMLAEFLKHFGPLSLVSGIISCYLICHFMKMLRDSILDIEEGITSFPDFNGFTESIILPWIRLVGCIFICLLPALFVEYFLNLEATYGIIALLLGAYYFPIAYMRCAALDSINGVNPIECFKVIFRIPLQYTGLSLFVFAGIRTYIYLPDGFIEDIILAPFVMYAISVYVHIFARFMHKHEDSMGWYEESDGFED